jgi:2-methylcitrate dehydratase PrpD
MKQDSTTQIQHVSRWIVNLQYEDIPEDVIYYSKLFLLDCISAICAGSVSDAGIRLKEALKAGESGGPYTLLPSGESWSLDNVLYYHSAMINALELDNFVYMGHVGQSVISASLAMGQKLNLQGTELLLAVVAATEVSGRLGANLVSGPQQGHMRSFIHRAGSAAAVAKICGHDESVTAEALAISLSMPEFPLYPACFSPDTKVICTGSPTVGGVKAAFMASEGMDGPLDIIEHPVGFYTSFSYSGHTPDIWKHIGKSWTLRTLSVKNFATCGYAQGPVNAAVRLKKNDAFTLEGISMINIYAPIVTLVMEKFSKPHLGASVTPVNTHFSTIRSVAAALLFGELTGDFYRAGTFDNKATAIQSLADRITLNHDWRMTIDSLRGIDAGLDNPGKPGFLSIGSGRKIFKRFKKAFGSRPLIQWKDLPLLINLPMGDLWYFLRRYLRSFAFSFNKRTSPAGNDTNYSHEGDLGKMAFCVSGRVEVIYKDGKKLSQSCNIPPGFANNPERDAVIKGKFLREAIPVWGEDKARKLMETILHLENYPVNQIFTVLKSG